MLTNIDIEIIRRQIADKFKPKKIIVFGSHARGDATDKSDLDLLILTEVAGSRRKLMHEIDTALNGFRLAKDILILTPSEFEISKNIPGTIARSAFQEGKVLYDAAN